MPRSGRRRARIHALGLVLALLTAAVLAFAAPASARTASGHRAHRPPPEAGTWRAPAGALYRLDVPATPDPDGGVLGPVLGGLLGAVGAAVGIIPGVLQATTNGLTSTVGALTGTTHSTPPPPSPSPSPRLGPSPRRPTAAAPRPTQATMPARSHHVPAHRPTATARTAITASGAADHPPTPATPAKAAPTPRRSLPAPTTAPGPSTVPAHAADLLNPAALLGPPGRVVLLGVIAAFVAGVLIVVAGAGYRGRRDH